MKRSGFFSGTHSKNIVTFPLLYRVITDTETSFKIVSKDSLLIGNMSRSTLESEHGFTCSFSLSKCADSVWRTFASFPDLWLKITN
jgi:hypothetical protein